MLTNLQLRYALDPWQVLTPEQNFTFFVPTNEAWDMKVLVFPFKCSPVEENERHIQVAPSLRARMNDGNHWLALQYVYKRHVIQGQVRSLCGISYLFLMKRIQPVHA